MSTTKTAIGLGWVIGISAGCWSYDDGHCGNNGGNNTCAERGGGAFCNFCEAKNAGCVDERPSDDCYFAGPGADDSSTSAGTSAGTDPTIAGTEPTSATEPTGPTETSLSTTMTASDTESSSATSSGCMDSSECVDPLAPICREMACVACGDAEMPDDACEERDAGSPVCGNDGACVQCTATNPSACDGTTPMCDEPSSTCVACTFHEQCEATACDIATGACFDDGCVVEVDGDGGADYTSIGPAIADGCVVIVHELDGAASYQAPLSIDGETIALLAASGEQPVIQGTGGNPSLSVTGSANVYVQGLRFSQSTDIGIDVDGATIWLDRTQAVGNDGGGLFLQGGADGHLRNCFVGGAADVPAVVVDSSTASILYSTLGGAFDAPALSCNDPTSVLVRNSIILSRAVTSDVDCDDADISYSATETLVAGTGNVAVGALDAADATAWFADYNGGDFSLSSGGGNTGEAQFGDVAHWLPGDPATDIDGDARPNVDGTADVAGADIP